MRKRILVAVGTSLSDTGLLTGIELARECGAHLSALHVINMIPLLATVAGYDLGIAASCSIEDQGRAVANRSARLMKDAGIAGETLTITLPTSAVTVGRAISDAARDLNADLIVLGTGKVKGWRFWKESMSDAVTRHAGVSVLIAKGPGLFADKQGSDERSRLSTGSQQIRGGTEQRRFDVLVLGTPLRQQLFDCGYDRLQPSPSFRSLTAVVDPGCCQKIYHRPQIELGWF
ncbi:MULTISPECIES: universal stress protein [Paraburkholderia]|uniref:universal stress protein n=1 Tax=Paraburkholderia TaxID=1822464 RepID=UPI00224FF26F|nr:MULTISPECIES: universal stress protein [Paraburkholderia]MCX4159675.1 universal stress protein [Paraburkholderia aspalathi]MDN7169072.1 universal stress protein [Paraburkholderia sp. SECH2]MDQ6397560.1 universal stress protein [Paraburkholderia aspalathi]